MGDRYEENGAEPPSEDASEDLEEDRVSVQEAAYDAVQPSTSASQLEDEQQEPSPNARTRRFTIQMVAPVSELLKGTATLEKTIDLGDFDINENTQMHIEPMRVDSPVTLGLRVTQDGVVDGPITAPGGNFHTILYPGMKDDTHHLADIGHMNDFSRLEDAADELEDLPLSANRSFSIKKLWGTRLRDIEEPSKDDKSKRANELRKTLSAQPVPSEGTVIIGANHPVMHLLPPKSVSEYGEHSFQVSTEDFKSARQDLHSVVGALTPHYQNSVTISLHPAFPDDNDQAYDETGKDQWANVTDDISAHYAKLGLNPKTAYPDDIIRTSYNIILTDGTDEIL